MDSILVMQLLFAAFCFCLSFSIGGMYFYADVDFKEHTRKHSIVMDFAVLALAVFYAYYTTHNGWAIVSMAAIMRLFYAMFLNLFEFGNLFRLDENKRVDRFLRHALNVQYRKHGIGAGVMQFIILVLVIVLVNLFFLT